MSVYDYLYYIILPTLSVSILIIFIRFLIGPKLSDRVVALDLLLTTGIGIIAVYSVTTNQPAFLDIAMILALIAFLGTVAFAYYLEKREKND
ncbi:MAG: cation:proton antiporter [Bacteroidota bacterium]|uniref:Multisubunit sodium/proton antiporter, MrpF subunit n=1 Tax=Algoriphagus faecimaris TaxID=686796 RepID=A0A1G6NVL5_9BACT|nr:cation:proton antiporter [Algoriphagus faecimaris]SDC71983.1 multisubunit sodium/proton antiporter, MrpF subunit [Algoriphagus faecimaris]